VVLSIEVVLYFLTVFVALVGFIGQRVAVKLDSIDKDLKDLLGDYGQRIAKLEAREGFIDRRKEERKQFS